MTSEFNVHNAAGCEQLMGRWSQKLAPLFIERASPTAKKFSTLAEAAGA
jgi:hypothetical protein